jgi:diaminohydroxyphosphoribosylaminopyrimidine deaminase/5-amino-6-(5-phosphoribosylamino)uracil reductase
VAKGYHRKFGGPHAEVNCLRDYRGTTRGAVLYVNLEPCSHHGKTPPCTGLILERGIPEVVVGMVDPNPLVRGRGIRALRSAGVRVRTGVLGPVALRLNERFVVGITQRRPYVHLKLAQSLDGYIAAAAGTETRISGREARALVHSWRARYDAVLVGAGTIRADDPSLTVRSEQGRDPDVVVLDGRLRAPAEARVFRSARRRRVFLVTARRPEDPRVDVFRRMGVTVLTLPSRGGRIPMRSLLRELYRQGVGSVLAEGGAEVAGQLLAQRVVDRLSLIVAPVLFGAGLKGCPVGRRFSRAGGWDTEAGWLGVDLHLSYRRR